MRLPVSVILSCCLTAALAKAGDEPKVGQQAPSLGPLKLYQAPSSAPTSIEGLKGKTIVLEFWATWCAPCIDKMPHMNGLSEKLKGKPVQFISVSNEDPERIERFLKKGLMKTWVASAPDSFKNFGVTFIPRTVVLDGEGKVALVTSPQDLTEEKLLKVIARERLEEKSAPQVIVPKNDAPMLKPVEPLFELSLKPSSSMASMTMMNPRGGVIQMMGATPQSLVSATTGLSPNNILFEFEAPPQRYDLRVKMPGVSQDVLQQRLKEAVEPSLGIEILREKRSVPVMVLTSPSGPKGDLMTTKGGSFHFSSSSGVLAGQNAPLSNFIASLQGELGAIIVDETNLKEKYDVLLLFTEGDRDSLLKALADLGLVLKEETREMEMAIVRKKA